MQVRSNGCARFLVIIFFGFRLGINEPYRDRPCRFSVIFDRPSIRKWRARKVDGRYNANSWFKVCRFSTFYRFCFARITFSNPIANGIDRSMKKELGKRLYKDGLMGYCQFLFDVLVCDPLFCGITLFMYLVRGFRLGEVWQIFR